MFLSCIGVNNRIVWLLGSNNHFDILVNKNNNEYTVIAMVRHSETEEALALYRAEYGKRELWVRPIKNFCELVDVGDSRVKRFELIAPIKSA